MFNTLLNTNSFLRGLALKRIYGTTEDFSKIYLDLKKMIFSGVEILAEFEEIEKIEKIEVKGGVEYRKVLYDYDAVVDDELTIKVDEIIEIRKKDGSGWWEGLNVITGKVGLFPYNYSGEYTNKEQLEIKTKFIKLSTFPLTQISKFYVKLSTEGVFKYRMDLKEQANSEISKNKSSDILLERTTKSSYESSKKISSIKIFGTV